MSAKYDFIGVNYAKLRKPDRRIARIIENALAGSADSSNYRERARTGRADGTDTFTPPKEIPRSMKVRGNLQPGANIGVQFYPS
jgi:hypothetical protein